MGGGEMVRWRLNTHSLERAKRGERGSERDRDTERERERERGGMQDAMDTSIHSLERDKRNGGERERREAKHTQFGCREAGGVAK